MNEQVVVLGIGRRPSKFMIVGEAPGRQEEEEELPFVGTAGNILSNMMKTIGIDERDAYITNVVKVFPPKRNDGSRTPDAKLIKEWRDVLWKEVLEIQPQLIIALGRIAAKELGLDKRERGFFHELDGRYWGFIGVWTYHPASIPRSRGKTQETIEEDCWKINKVLRKREWV